VNVSAYQLEHDDLPTLVARTLERHKLAPDSFEIELTESAALVDCDRARTLFASLRELGVRIAIDDFGTGYSSLSTLRSLAFDKIKIDREFVTEVESRKESQAICQSIIALARGLGIGVLAEGVERHEEYAWLRRHGCQKFQGYFFSPPLESAAFLAFAQNRQQVTAKLALDPRSLQQDIAERLSA
jgi:Amt family ammonium transporter